jgi:hypothetical protein
MYILEPAEHDKLLFFRLESEAAERYGAIGYLRADFGRDGREFFTTWFDSQSHLKTKAFKNEFDSLINSLRSDGEKPPLAGRQNLQAFTKETPGKDLPARGKGYVVQTPDYSYYFCCKPSGSDYDIYCMAYNNRWLLPELAGKHELPNNCFSVLPSTGELISIVMGKRGYFPSDKSTSDREINRQIASTSNALLGVTRGQEEAMLAGSLFGWNTPAARPWKYDPDGKPRIQPPKRSEPER